MGPPIRREPHTGGLAALLCLLLIPAPGASFSVLEEPETTHRQGRRIFGGYRIVPRACKPSPAVSRGGKTGSSDSGATGATGATGICMFNYECTRRGGEVVGACMDGFLFGACCSLPPGVVLDPASLPPAPPALSPPTPPPALAPASPPPPPPPTVDHPQADTVLMHHNGSEVVDNDLSEELFRPSTLQRPSYTEPDTDLLLPASSSIHTTLEPKHTTFALVTNVHEYTDRITNGRPMSTYQDSRVPTASYVTRPASLSSNTKFPTSARPPSSHTAARPHTEGSKRPPSTVASTTEEATTTVPPKGWTLSQSRPNFGDEVVTENVESINHILWILNDTEPYADPEPMPDPEPIPDPEPEALPQGGLSTWGSVNGLETSSIRPTVFRPVATTSKTTNTATTSAVRPITTFIENYHKTSYSPQSSAAASDKFRPGSSQTAQHDTSSFYHTTSSRPTSKPPAPTVIVLGPLSSDFTTIKPSTRLPPNQTSSRPAASHPSIQSSSYPTYSSKPLYTTTENYEGTNWTKHPLITVSRPSTSGVRPPSTDYHLHSSSNHNTDSYPQTRPVIVETTSFRPSTSVTVKPLGPSYYSSTSRPVDKVSSTYPPGLITTFITKRPPPSVSSITTATTNIPLKPPTILYTSSTSIRPSLGSMRPAGQNTIFAHNTTPGGPTIITKIPADDHPITSIDDLSNFPPVRNPSLNTSFFEHDRPPLVSDTEKPSISTPLVPEDELLENEITTPEFVEDDKLNSKLQLFVDKIVESLQGNFEDLEDVLYRRRNSTTPKPSPTRKPTQRPPPPPTRRPTTTVTTTRRPTRKPSRPSTSAASARPTQRPSSLRPGTSQRPGVTTRPVSSQRPGGSTSRPTSPQRPASQRPTTPQRPGSTQRPASARPTRPPAPATTRRPTTRPPTTTRRPLRPSTARPRPTRRSTTTSSYTNLVEPEDTTKPSRISTTPATTVVTTITPPDQEAVVAETLQDETTAPIETTLTIVPPTTTTTTTTTTTHRPVDYKHECGVRPLMQKHGRIVGGKGAAYGAWPWQVLVRESTWLGLFTKNKCGGVLLSNRYVVTAAHCQPGFLANLVAVMGEFDISGERESKASVTRNVRRVVVHRDYDAATFANDLALLELETHVPFDEHIVPICLPRDGEDFTGRIATVTGWGRLKYGGGVPSVLQEVQVPVIDNAVCQEMFLTAGHQKQILSSFLCAGYAHGQKDSCEGDSGGPLMLERPDGRWTLVGTVSHGIKCAAPYLPGVYMRTTYYKPWLTSITGIK